MSASTADPSPEHVATDDRSPSLLPVNQCCLVVPMPTVEEMRREVADITCQMQSVYLNDGVSSEETKGSGPSESQEPDMRSIQSLPLDAKSLVKSNTLGHKNFTEDYGRKTDTSRSTTTCSLPREMQVSEEFVINGKLYRQTYQKKVVLERQTTRDIFLLPASSSEPRSTEPGRFSLEYLSPNFIQMSTPNGQMKNEGNMPGSPLLSPSSLHCAQVRQNTDARAVPTSCSDGSQKLTCVEESHSKVHGEKGPQGTTNDPKVNVKEKESEGPRLFRSRARTTVRGLTEGMRKHLSAAMNRSRSARMKSMNKENKSGALATVERVDEQNGLDTPNRDIIGYMYQFGKWDSTAPVLDPRLSTSYSRDRIGVVCPTPAEWHHAEVGGDTGLNSYGPFVRGRIVACLQRFTQNSLTSGKALHRSTYVQQTRLVRHRQRRDSGSDQTSACETTIPFNANVIKTQCGQDVAMDLISLGLSKNEKKPGVPGDDASIANQEYFPACENERLQLLQSICPAAAAATILLGQGKLSGLEETEDDLPDIQSPTNTEKKTIVMAHSWCAPALIARDLSAYLIFHDEPLTESTKSGQDQKANENPQLLLKAGTLEGLLVYALHFLQIGSTDVPLDHLFPNVFRVIYPTFTKAEQVMEKLIQIYVAFAPIEPGCMSSDWKEALTAAAFVVTLAKEIPPEQLSASLVLRLARFARLLILDGQLRNIEANGNHAQSAESVTHKELAENLLDGLPLLSASAQLRERVKFHHLRGGNKTKYDGSVTNRVKQASPSDSKKVDNAAVKTPMNGDLVAQGKMSSHRASSPKILSIAMERTKKLLTLDPLAVAMELTRMEEEKFAKINFQELLDINRLQQGETPTLAGCVEHFNAVTLWARSQIWIYGPKLYSAEERGKPNEKEDNLASDKNERINGEDHKTIRPNSARPLSSEDDASRSQERRVQTQCIPSLNPKYRILKSIKVRQMTGINLVFRQLCEILKHLKDLRNFSSFLAILLAIQEIPENLLFKKSRTLLSSYVSYMRPPVFSEYRHDLESASLPYLPYLGLIFQQLIHLDAGNPLYISDPVFSNDQADAAQSTMDDHPPSLDETFKRRQEKFINAWRCWKHYLILGYFVKRRDDPQNSSHKIDYNEEVANVLNQLEDKLPETIINESKNRMMNRKIK